MTDIDSRVRLAAFAFLEAQRQLHGDMLSQKVLHDGFVFENQRVPLLNPAGIFKPAILPVYPLSFRTAPPSLRQDPPYPDELDKAEGLIRYRYRGTDPQHRDNVGLRLAMRDQVPLIYLYGIIPGEYCPVWPVFIVGDDPQKLTFSVSIKQRSALQQKGYAIGEGTSEAKRRYSTVEVLRRLHQRGFRERVLNPTKTSRAPHLPTIPGNSRYAVPNFIMQDCAAYWAICQASSAAMLPLRESALHNTLYGPAEGASLGVGPR